MPHLCVPRLRVHILSLEVTIHLQALLQHDKDFLVRAYRLMGVPLLMLCSPDSSVFSKYHATQQTLR